MKWGSSSVTLHFALIAHRLLKHPLFSRQEAQTPLPVWLQQRQNRKCLLLLLLPSWRRRSAGDRWAACWATAWRRRTTTEETNGSRSNLWRLKDRLRLKLLFWSHLHFYNLQSRRDGSSEEGKQTVQSNNTEWSLSWENEEDTFREVIFKAAALRWHLCLVCYYVMLTLSNHQ